MSIVDVGYRYCWMRIQGAGTWPPWRQLQLSVPRHRRTTTVKMSRAQVKSQLHPLSDSVFSPSTDILNTHWLFQYSFSTNKNSVTFSRGKVLLFTNKTNKIVYRLNKSQKSRDVESSKKVVKLWPLFHDPTNPSRGNSLRPVFRASWYELARKTRKISN